MSTADFEVAYDGPATEGGVMDVRQLAPALLSLAKLVEDANRAVNGKATTASVQVRAPSKRGSFPLELSVGVNLHGQIGSLVSGGPEFLGASALIALLGFLGSTADGITVIQTVLGFFKRTKGKPAKTVTKQDNGTLMVTMGDGSHFTVNGDVYAIASDPNVRKDMDEVLKPLRTQGGVTEFQIRLYNEVVERITRADIPAIAPVVVAHGDVVLHEGESDKWVNVHPHGYTESEPWHFFDGSPDGFEAMITDAEFWRRVHTDEIAFTEHALFHVHVRWTKWQKANGRLVVEHEVTNVWSHRPAGGQIEMPGMEGA